MNSVFASIDPIAFSLGPLEVRWYGVIIAMGIVIGYLIAQREMIKRGFHADFLADLLMWVLPLSILGARFYYVAFEWSHYPVSYTHLTLPTICSV